jgi:hypothetical protein
MRRALVAVALVLATLGAGGRALGPDTEPDFRRLIAAVNDAHALGDGVRVEGISIEPVEARVSLAVGGALATVHLDATDEDGPGRRTRFFRVRVDPPGALAPPAEDHLAALLDASFPEDPFRSTGAAPRPAPGEARGDRPRSLDDARRRALAATPDEHEFVSARAMNLTLALLGVALAAALAFVLRARRR